MKKPLQKTAGFTLIEIMISLVLLIVISTMLSDVFSGSSNAITSANRKSDTSLQGRVALDLMAKELEGALINTNFQLTVLSAGKDVRFFSTSNINNTDENDVKRSFMPVNYYVSTSNTLNRWYESPENTAQINQYIGAAWDDPSGPPTTGNDDILVNYVTQFEVRINNRSLLADRYGLSETNIPYYADIVLGVLGEEDARTAGELNVSTDWIEQRENLFTTRIYFRNTPLEE
jgi:type II secretory pathway pseudopilin PulG